MSKIIIGTLLIMGVTFLIGFAVAYLIKFISTTLSYFEHFSLSNEIEKRKRLILIRKFQRNNSNELFSKAQSELNNELLEYRYPRKKEEEKYDYLHENELTRYRYGKN